MMRTLAMRGRGILSFIVVWLSFALPASAAFHLMQIEQVIGGVNGDPTAQAIQLRTRAAFQNDVSQARLVVRDAAGLNPVIVMNMASDVFNSAAGSRVLIASTNFSLYTTPAAAPDFTMTNLIPPSYLAAGSLTYESDAGAIIYWRLSWGGAGYTGSNAGNTANDADGNFGPPFAGPLQSSNRRAVRFPGLFSALSTSNAADYALTGGASTFTRNSGTAYAVTDPAPEDDCNSNGIHDSQEADADTDGLIDDCDNCPNTPNSSQEDCDADGLGDACEDDCNTNDVPDECEFDTQIAKLLASDAAAGDEFGFSIAVSGNTALVGAYLDDHAGGGQAGSAYVYVLSGGVWSQQAKLIGSDTASNDWFGATVAIAGDTAVVGARFHNHAAGSDAGAAYVFTRSGSVWTQQQKLTASDAAASDQFGVSVAIFGDTTVVGAGNDDHAGGADAGSAYVFTRAGSVWTEQQKLTASDAAASDIFGASVALLSDTAVIGAYLNDDAGSGSGSAYVFTPSQGVWTEQAKLTASDAAANDQFGQIVAVSGDTAVVGAQFDDHAGGADAGSAYVFAKPGGGWTTMTETAKLIASDAAASDRFGNSVSVSGDTAVVGAWVDDHTAGVNAGSAYIFARSGSAWPQQAKLIASDPAAGDRFGASVVVSGNLVVVGAHTQDNTGGADAGSAYVISYSDCNQNSVLDACETDTDMDGVIDNCDNCPAVANANQTDVDADLIGNACDNCVTDANSSQENTDTDEYGDVCDNCPSITNSQQRDCDSDGIGDVCDSAPGCVDPIVDGMLDNLYCDALAVQNNQTSFGDSSLGQIDFANGNEIDAVYGTIKFGYLYLFLAGNLAHDRTKLDIFIDSQPGGQNRLLDGNSGHPLYVPLDRMGDDGSGNGLTFDAAFVPDYFIQVNADTQGGYSLYFDYVELGVGGDTYWLGTGGAGTDGMLSGGDSPFDGMLCTINNTNVAGVTGGNGAGSGTGVTTGVELKFPLIAIGNPAGSFKVCVFINGTGQEFVSNQVLGGLGGVGSLGEPRTVNFSTIGGNQYVTVTGPIDADTDGVPDCADNCPNAPNSTQVDYESDGVGDICDNCPIHTNPGQEDCDSDGVGDACDDIPPARLYVDATATGGNNGSTWANAFTELRDALQIANCPPGDSIVTEIWVADGNYKPAPLGGSQAASFKLRNNLAIYGGFASGETMLSERNPSANLTKLSGDLSDNDGPNFTNYSDNSRHVVTTETVNLTAVLDGFTIIGGADISPPPFGGGGGLSVISGGPQIRRCMFFANRSTSKGGAVLAGAGATFINCLFAGNLSEAVGGGAVWGNNLTMINCAITGNTAAQLSGGGVGGGGVSGTGSFVNCTFSRNAATGTSHSGGLYTSAGPGTITNCVFSGNTATTNPQIGGTATVTYSCVEGGYAGTGNINADPQFADTDGPDDVAGNVDDNLRILAESPCIDAANSPAVPADTADLDGDLNTSEPTPLDLDGNKRLVDDPYTTDTGIPGSPVVDMGAYEYFPDCDNNGIDDADDIANDPTLDSNPMDGVIDSCCFCAAAGVWSLPATWNCGNVPDNGTPQPGDRYNVNITCPVPAVTLDIPVTIDSVVVEPGQALNVTGGNLTLDAAGGIQNDGSLTIGAGRMVFAQASSKLEGASPITLNHPTAMISSGPSSVFTCTGTISGQGVIDARLTNGLLGVIRGDANGGTLSVTGSFAKINNGLMSATAGGTLEIFDTIVTSVLSLGRYSADGGTLRVVDSSPFRGGRGSTTRVEGDRLELSNGAVFEISGAAEVELTGPVSIDSLATFLCASGANGSFSAGSMTINSSSNGGRMFLTEQVEMVVGDIGSIGCGAFLAGIEGTGIKDKSEVNADRSAPRGCTPPVLSVSGGAGLEVNGDFGLEGAINVLVDSTQPVLLAGDFDNRSDNTAIFDWDSGDLTMDGAATQTFELAGIDYGPRDPVAGGAHEGFVDNYAMGTLRVEVGCTVDFVNTFDNVAGAGCEVLYVQTLSLGGPSTIRLNGCYVYYDVLIKDSDAVVQLQGGALMSIHAGDLDNDGDADVTDAAMLANYLVGGSCSATCQARADVNGDGVANALDIQWMVRVLTEW